MPIEKKSDHYVNNKQFLESLIEYNKEVRKAFFEQNPSGSLDEIKTWRDPSKPPIPRYIGECFLKIATHLSFKPNFVNYIFKDDMISDGIENCVQYIHNFNPEKSDNPFAYFTQIIYYAFLRRISKEKKQLEIKNKILERSGYDQVFTDDQKMYGSNYSDYNSIKDSIQTKMRS